MIGLTNITKIYGETKALQAVNLAFGAGKTTVVIGPSGCGKSTLLRVIIGLLRPDSGSVTFKEREVAPQDWLLLRRKMGYVIQEGGLFPHLRAGDNVTLMARYLAWERERITQRLNDLAAMTRLSPQTLDRFPAELSGGQRQRVSLMRALMLDPDVLLLDEPLGALDPLTRADLQSDLRQVFRQLRKTVVLVTHDLGEAAFFGDLVVLLRDGRVVQSGTLAELIQAPVDPFVTHFINAQRSPLDSIAPQRPGQARDKNQHRPGRAPATIH